MLENKYSLKNKVAVISGASGGMGVAVAKRLLRDGCHVVTLSKYPLNWDDMPQNSDAHLMPLICDMTDGQILSEHIDKIISTFGQVDYLINAASVISLTGTVDTSMKHFDMMFDVNMRGTYMISKMLIPFLKQSDNAHILNFSPPLVMDAAYFHSHGAYTMSKYAMSMCALGMAHELYSDGIAVNCLWPRTLIHNDILQIDSDMVMPISESYMRHPAIMADAAQMILSKPAPICTGTFMIDDLVLQAHGIRNFDIYAVQLGNVLIENLFLPRDLPPPPHGVLVQSFNFNIIDTKH